MDLAELDLSDAFAPGQVYVALSRVRSLKGLRMLSPLVASCIKAPPLVSAFEAAFVVPVSTAAHRELAPTKRRSLSPCDLEKVGGGWWWDHCEHMATKAVPRFTYAPLRVSTLCGTKDCLQGRRPCKSGVCWAGMTCTDLVGRLPQFSKSSGGGSDDRSSKQGCTECRWCGILSGIH